MRAYLRQAGRTDGWYPAPDHDSCFVGRTQRRDSWDANAL